jgi:hypothetical protein
MSHRYSELDLEGYLDEGLAAEKMVELETALRHDGQLMQRLVQIIGRRDAGLHSIGAVWRRHRLSCPDRGQLGSYLLGALSPERLAYIRFHLEQISCRHCLSNLADLRRQQEEASEIVVVRRKKYFQSSAGYLGRRD